MQPDTIFEHAGAALKPEAQGGEIEFAEQCALRATDRPVECGSGEL
jgi:hypothetical protein